MIDFCVAILAWSAVVALICYDIFRGNHAHRESKHPLDYAVFVLLVITAIGTGFAAFYTKGERDVMEKQEIRQLRAYVAVYPGGFSKTDLNSDQVVLTMAPHVKVFGQTPARRIMTFGQPDHIVLQYPLSPGTKLPEAEGKVGWSSGSLFPGDDVPMEPFHIAISQADFLNIKAGTHHLYVYGEVAFYDVFGIPRMTEWCYSYGYAGLVSGAATLCPTHDYTKNDDYDPADRPFMRASPREENRLNQMVFGHSPQTAKPSTSPPSSSPH